MYPYMMIAVGLNGVGWRVITNTYTTMFTGPDIDSCDLWLLRKGWKLNRDGLYRKRKG